jgi:hypothetical protein
MVHCHDHGRSPPGKRKESSVIKKEAKGGAMSAVEPGCVAGRGKAGR